MRTNFPDANSEKEEQGDQRALYVREVERDQRDRAAVHRPAAALCVDCGCGSRRKSSVVAVGAGQWPHAGDWDTSRTKRHHRWMG